MFQFPRLPSRICGMNRLNTGTGYPIRESPTMPVRRLIEAYRSLTAPFIGPWSQGIHRKPLII